MTEAVRVLAECPLAVASLMGMADMETGPLPVVVDAIGTAARRRRGRGRGGSGSRELVEDAYYEKFFRGGLTDAHRTHDATWHPSG